MSKSALTPLFLSLSLAGCATLHTVESVVPAKPGEKCWVTTQREVIKGEGKNAEVVDRQIVGHEYSKECGDREVKTAVVQSDSRVEEARMNALSTMLSATLISPNAKPETLDKAVDEIIARRRSADPAVSQSQIAADLKVGFKRDEDILSKRTVHCRKVLHDNGPATLECD